MRFVCTVLLAIVVFQNKTCCASGNSVSPILVLATNNNFGTYTAEILKTEGFNEYKTDSLTSARVNLSYLNKFDLVILAETPVKPSHKTMLADYVRSGGDLIAFRPDKQLSEIFGIIDAKGTIDEGYIRINTATGVGKGLVPVPVQFHGKSDVYKLNGAESVAELYSDAANSTQSPSLVVNNYGRGHAAAFTYNLPKSIVFTRQGNPEWAGQERDNVDGPTPADLFYPQTGDKQWNDPDKIAIPQADEQMRLLTHLIEKFNSCHKPLPRFWYFPDQCRCIFIFTIDGEESPESEIKQEISEVNNKGAKATLYEIGTYISASTIKEWQANGNEVAIHYNDVPNYANPTYSNMKPVLDTMTSNFRNAYGISPKTVRNHWVVWCSKDSLGNKQFAEQATLEEKYGLGLDCNYYQFGGNKVYPNWLGDVGHYTGSGIPMKFADASGKILNIYQSNTQLPDETWLKENIESKSKILIDRSLDEENFTYINANFHTWYWGECRVPGLRVLDYCNNRGVPVWTAEKVHDFLKMKDEASFSGFTWINNQLTFKLNSAIKHANGLTFLLPLKYCNLKIKGITVNGQSCPFEQSIIKGFEYALLTVTAGNTYDISVNYH